MALKKIVANMTMSNNDMVALFPDVVNCMQIDNWEIKKMYALLLCSFSPVLMLHDYRCFLYLTNYARMKPDMAVKALPVLLNVRFHIQPLDEAP